MVLFHLYLFLCRVALILLMTLFSLASDLASDLSSDLASDLALNQPDLNYCSVLLTTRILVWAVN